MMSENEVLIDESIDADPTATSRIQEIADLQSVQRVIALADLHQGEQETPTSIVAAVQDAVYPELSSNVINCGMSLIRTELNEEDLTDEFISTVSDTLKQKAEQYEPTSDDVLGYLSKGAGHVVEQHELEETVLEHIENGGCMFAPDTSPKDVSSLVPPWLLKHEGTYQDTPVPSLGSNHFIEFQIVDEIVDEETAQEWNIEEGEVVIFMHGDYALTFYLNWHHANRHKFREKISAGDRAKMQLSKAAYHLWRDGVRNFRKNWRRFNSDDRFTRFDVHSEQGQHLVNVIYAAMNFGYANRLVASICLEEAISESLDGAGKIELLWDVGHDTIQQETIEGEEYWIHRKGAAKAVPDKPALVSGSYNMNSFLGKCQHGASAYLNSYDHGCSNVIDYYESKGKLSEIDSYTKMYDYGDGSLQKTVQHVASDPIESVVEGLVDKDVFSEVVWLRPVANISE